MKSFFVCVTVASLFWLGGSEELPSVSEALAKVNGVINLPQLQGLNITELPIGHAEGLLRKKCENFGNPEAYEKAKTAGTQLFECARGLVNFTQFKEELDKARPQGELDEVFKKYCDKRRILQGCVLNFTNAIDPCLDEYEKRNLTIIQNVTEKIIEFSCHHDGDRIALFISAKGPECFQWKAQSLVDCVNATFGKGIDTSKFSSFDPVTAIKNINDLQDIPRLVFDTKTCRNMDTLQTCVVKSLEECDEPTPSNLIESIFKYIRKVTTCEEILDKKT